MKYRTQMYLEKEHYEYLLRERERTGASMAEILRRIIDKHIEEVKGNGKV